jgi:hypothetical protein
VLWLSKRFGHEQDGGCRQSKRVTKSCGFLRGLVMDKMAVAGNLKEGQSPVAFKKVWSWTKLRL